MKLTNEICISFLRGSGWLYNHDKEITISEHNKAIDDFAEQLKSECREHYVDCDPYFGGITDSILYEDDIEEIAEQLKAGESE